MPRPARFTPRKDPVPLYRRLGGPQARSGRVRKISPPPGFDPRSVQSVASRYTDCAIPAHGRMINYLLIKKSVASGRGLKLFLQKRMKAGKRETGRVSG